MDIPTYWYILEHIYKVCLYMCIYIHVGHICISNEWVEKSKDLKK